MNRLNKDELDNLGCILRLYSFRVYRIQDVYKNSNRIRKGGIDVVYVYYYDVQDALCGRYLVVQTHLCPFSRKGLEQFLMVIYKFLCFSTKISRDFTWTILIMRIVRTACIKINGTFTKTNSRY